MEITDLKEGLYIAQGVDQNVLIRVAGKAPMLTICSGVLLNDMARDGTIRALTTEDVEIQDILSRPETYIFTLPSITESVYGSFGVSKAKKIEYTPEQFEKIVTLYKKYFALYRDNAPNKFIAHVVREYRYSVTQAKSLLTEVTKKVRL